MTTTGTRRNAADLLAIAFGTTAAMWTIGYVCRLFGDAVPAALIFVLVLAVLVLGGVVVGRYTGRGALGGVYVGLLSGLVNLFIVGSLIGGRTPNEIKSGALLWVPGTLAVSMLLASIGTALGALRPSRTARPPDWPGILATVAACATFVLLAAGGLVTGFDEGLAVVDWPNTEGYNMFLYPLARMTGGIYLEHAHRLLGSLVGLTTLVLAIHVQVTERPRALKILAWTALAFVVVQGILGGLRVTGRLTLSTQPADTDPNVALAAVHGIFGQVVFATLVALAVCRSRAWREAGAPLPSISASLDRIFESCLIVVLIAQLVLGALVRHFSWALDILRYGLSTDPARLKALGEWALMLHVSVAVVVILLGLTAGVRAWGIYQTLPRLRRLGTNVLLLLGIQVALGVAALIMAGNDAANRRPTALDVVVTTAHQIVGAALLAWAVMLLLWNHRLLAKQSPA
jgi:heme A synthase